MANERSWNGADTVTEVVVVCEGKTEEAFVRALLEAPFSELGIYVQSRLISTSTGSKGGALSPERVLRGLRNTLLQRGDTYVSTFFDLYGLHPGFPGNSVESEVPDSLARAAQVEQSLHRIVVEMTGCLPERFLPHIQPHEFEALLFSDIGSFSKTNPEWRPFSEVLRSARAGATTPEHINDGPNTHPSARLLTLPGYKKVTHGILVAKRIGLHKIRSECQHFDLWLSRIEKLRPLAQRS